jgi:hypothetical protein
MKIFVLALALAAGLAAAVPANAGSHCTTSCYGNTCTTNCY